MPKPNKQKLCKSEQAVFLALMLEGQVDDDWFDTRRLTETSNFVAQSQLQMKRSIGFGRVHDILSKLEKLGIAESKPNMAADFPGELTLWRATEEFIKAQIEHDRLIDEQQ